MKERNFQIFKWISLILIYIAPTLISSIFFKAPLGDRVDIGIYRDDPARYVLTAEIIQNTIADFKPYVLFWILAFASIRFIGMLLYKKIDMFSSLILFFGILCLLSFDYSIFKPMEYNAATFSKFLMTQDRNSLYHISAFCIICLMFIYPLIQIFKYIKKRLKNR